MVTLDLTRYGRRRVSFYLALEKYLLNAPEWRDRELFFIWDIFPAIVCGKHQLIPSEVNMTHVARLGVPVYRRHSGGGTIYADEGCFMFTFLKRSQRRDDVFRECLSEVVRAFGELGVATELSGRNDLLCRGKKFSGNAYYRNDNGSILHGTLLYDTDFEDMVRCITPDNAKLVSKGIESVRQRVINMKEYVGMGREELMRHLEHTITNGAAVLTDREYEQVEAIEREYLTAEWIEGNNPPFTFSNKQRFAFGLVEAHIDVKGGVIRDIKLTGDFFTHRDLEPLYDALRGVPFDRAAIESALEHHPVDTYILGASKEDILSVIC